MYQGHLNDGSSIQAHSAGGLYPYVIYAQGADVLTYGVIVPGQSGYIVGTYDEAVAHASALKDGTGARTNGQCFEVGTSVRIDGRGLNGIEGWIEQMHRGFQALVVYGQHNRRQAWVPLTSLTVIH